MPSYYGWPTPQPQTTPQDYQPPPTVYADTIFSALQALNIDQADIAAVLESSGDILLNYSKRTQQIVVSREFRAWSSSPNSCELLIQGYPARDSTQAARAMALISASLMESLRNRGHFISLVFFCGKHTEPEDTQDASIGPSAILRSFITQLLQQHYATSVFREQDIDFKGLNERDIHALCRMLDWLVRQLPQEKTLVCVIDAVNAYETDEWEEELTALLRFLLGLARDKSLPPAFKLLVTSPTGTLDIHQEFGDEDGNILYIESLQSAGEEAGLWELADGSSEDDE